MLEDVAAPFVPIAHSTCLRAFRGLSRSTCAAEDSKNGDLQPALPQL